MLNELLGITENASAHGMYIDHMLELCHWFMLILFVGWSAFFFYTIWRFNKRRSPVANYTGVRSHASTHIEVGVVFVEAVLLIGFAFPLWAQRVSVNEFPDEKQAVVVHVVAEAFGWNYHYAGPDGKFGPRRLDLIDANNPIGLDFTAPQSQDDIVTRTTMVIPVNRPVIARLGSKDVIHNFAVKHMRVAQDTIPGMNIPVWFTAIREGEFEIICGQLCGAGHYSMKGWLEVVSAADYETWLQQRSAAMEPLRQAALQETGL